MHLTMHIGTEKTGTTTIQRFMHMNRGPLAARGILVPVSPGQVNQRKLTAVAYNPDRQDDLMREHGLADPQHRAEVTAQWWQEFCDEVKRFPGQRVLVSSEHFHSRLRSREEVERLHDILKTVFKQIDVILYLREPVQTAVSLFSTAVRSGVHMKSVPPPDNEYFGSIVNHKRSIELWSSVFGPGNLRLRLFDRNCFHNGDLLDDFIQVADLPDDIPYKQPEPQNESLSNLGIELLSRLNGRQQERIKQGNADPRFNRVQAALCNVLTSGTAHLPSPATVQAYREAFSESNEWVRQNYFPAREALFRETDYENKTKPVQLPDDELEALCDVIEMIAGIPPRT